MKLNFDPYAILGVSSNASADDIKRAYRRLAQRFHPDVNPSKAAHQQFQDITTAYNLLSDESQRRIHDSQVLATRNPDDSYFTLRVTPSKRSIAIINEEQALYLLAEIFPAPTSNDAPRPDINLNLTLVLDQSNSMQGSRMERVKLAAQKIIDSLGPGDIISVVSFNDRATVIIPATRVQDKANLRARVSMIKAAGSTEMYQGLFAGVGQCRKFLGPRLINHVLLVTDGHTFGDQDRCFELAEIASREGIGISALGLGHDWNDDFLDKLTALTGGSTSFISSADVVTRFMDDHVRNLSSAFAERMFLSVASDPDVQLMMAFRLAPNPQPLEEQDGRIALSSLQANRPIAILLQFTIQENSKPGFRSVARLLVGGDILQNQDQAFRAVSDISIEAMVSPPSEEPPNVIMDALNKLTLYRMQERARDAMERGDVDEATKRLEYLATRLFELGENQLASQAEAEAKFVAKTRALSDEGRKTLKYSTRALISPDGLGDALSSFLADISSSSDIEDSD